MASIVSDFLKMEERTARALGVDDDRWPISDRICIEFYDVDSGFSRISEMLSGCCYSPEVAEDS
jgi:hypothetical protein